MSDELVEAADFWRVEAERADIMLRFIGAKMGLSGPMMNLIELEREDGGVGFSTLALIEDRGCPYEKIHGLRYAEDSTFGQILEALDGQEGNTGGSVLEQGGPSEEFVQKSPTLWQKIFQFVGMVWYRFDQMFFYLLILLVLFALAFGLAF